MVNRVDMLCYVCHELDFSGCISIFILILLSMSKFWIRRAACGWALLVAQNHPSVYTLESDNMRASIDACLLAIDCSSWPQDRL